MFYLANSGGGRGRAEAGGDCCVCAVVGWRHQDCMDKNKSRAGLKEGGALVQLSRPRGPAAA
jgi:hypothetical protein